MSIRASDGAGRRPATRGAAALAAVIVVAAIGIFSTVLHFIDPVHNMALKAERFVAATISPLPAFTGFGTEGPLGGATAGAPAPVTATSPAKPLITYTEPAFCQTTPKDSMGRQYCACNSAETLKKTGTPAPDTPQISGITAQCLPGCSYSIDKQSNGQYILRIDATEPRGEKGPISVPGAQCQTRFCDEKGACKPAVSVVLPNATATANEIVAKSLSGDAASAYNATNDFLANGGKLTDLQAALAKAESTVGVGTLHDLKESAAYKDIRQQLEAYASAGESGEFHEIRGTGLSLAKSISGGSVGTLNGDTACPSYDLDCRSGKTQFNRQPSDGPLCINGLAGCTPSGPPKNNATFCDPNTNPSCQKIPGPPAPPPPTRRPGIFDGLGNLFGGNGLNQLLNGFMRGMMMQGGGLFGGGNRGNNTPVGNTTPQYPGSCSTQYKCSGQTLYYRNDRCVDQPMQYCQHGCSGTQCAQSPQSQGQYGRGTDGQPCQQPPAQPPASSCTTGTWKSVSATGNNCTTGWQCVPNNSSETGLPAASISCSSQVADVGASLTIQYRCERSTDSSGGGFDTKHQLSGSTTTVIARPPAGYDTATYTLSCTNGAQTRGAQCSVQINDPQIALTADPSVVASGTISTIGWVTSGMRACTVSSPDIPGFTAQNASHTNANGTAKTPALSKSVAASVRVYLDCETYGGGTRQASTTITVQ